MATLKDIERLTSKFERLLNVPKDKLLIRRNYGKFGLSINTKRSPQALTGLLSKKDYEVFERIFLEVLNIHAPNKKKVIRANQKPYITKQLRKAIMRRSYLQNKFYKYRTEELSQAFKKQKN